LQDLTFEAALDWVAAQGIEAVEIGTGNFSTGPHCNLESLVNDAEAASRFKDALAARGLHLSALNCNGNLLDPHPARQQSAQATFYKTVEAARRLGLDTIVTMSGCPGDPTGGEYPNWVTCTWQREFVDLAERQWEEAIIPFWREAGRFAADHGIQVAIEMHPGQSVYNPRGLLRLRETAGPCLGANLDPSHLFWQGMDPLVVVRALGPGGVFHVHAKDTRLDPQEMALNGVLDLRATGAEKPRAWAFRTVGYGHDAGWWRDFVSELRRQGYDGVLSIEHEDRLMGSREGIVKSVEFLRPLVLTTTAEHWL
jgi:sugar phosphate isomerase/epimerase